MLKQKCSVYLRLMRWHRPIGVFLLFWPTMWGIWIAGTGQPDLTIVLIFIAGVFVMRPAGCIINDIADRNFDGYVARTKERPLATGEVSLKEAWILFVSLLTIAFGLVLLLNVKTLLLACVALALSCLYPFTKRVTYLPQFVLGIAWYISVLMPFTAQQNQIPLIAWVLYASVILWTVAYDTIYAMADREDDLKIGVKSTAILFGRYDRLMIGLLQLSTLVLWVIVGLLLNANWPYFLALGFVMILFIYQQIVIAKREPSACIRAFLHNNWVGACVFIGILGTR